MNFKNFGKLQKHPLRKMVNKSNTTNTSPVLFSSHTQTQTTKGRKAQSAVSTTPQPAATTAQPTTPTPQPTATNQLGIPISTQNQSGFSQDLLNAARDNILKEQLENLKNSSGAKPDNSIFMRKIMIPQTFDRNTCKQVNIDISDKMLEMVSYKCPPMADNQESHCASLAQMLNALYGERIRIAAKHADELLEYTSEMGKYRNDCKPREKYSGRRLRLIRMKHKLNDNTRKLQNANENTQNTNQNSQNTNENQANNDDQSNIFAITPEACNSLQDKITEKYELIRECVIMSSYLVYNYI